MYRPSTRVTYQRNQTRFRNWRYSVGAIASWFILGKSVVIQSHCRQDMSARCAGQRRLWQGVDRNRPSRGENLSSNSSFYILNAIEIILSLHQMEVRNTRESLPASSTQTIETGKQSTRFSKSSVKSVSGGRQSGQGSSKRPSIEEPTSSILPTKLLRPNFVVDLMQRPGDLIPLGTKRADDYIASISNLKLWENLLALTIKCSNSWIII